MIKPPGSTEPAKLRPRAPRLFRYASLVAGLVLLTGVMAGGLRAFQLRADPDRDRSLKEFERAQRTQLGALKRRHRTALKELESAQRAAFKEWERTEQTKRREFFAANPKGPDRREYVQGMLQRRKALAAEHRATMDQRKREQSQERTLLEAQQTQRRELFVQALARGEKPPIELWPGVMD